MRGFTKLAIVINITLLSVGLLVSCAWAQGSSAKSEKLVVYKSKRELALLKDGKVAKTYRISLGRQPVGPKTRRGDGKTPEGTYTIDRRNPNSRFHLALHVSYPSASDITRARMRGVDPGGNIMIHGLPNRSRRKENPKDWTAGCIALSNRDIEELWHSVQDGIRVEIMP